MNTPSELEPAIVRIEERLAGLDKKVEQLLSVRHKSMEWLATMAEQVESLDAFREEVRQSLEPLFDKLRDLDEIMRILRHATSDVARRVDEIEGMRRKAG
jgi:prefoldin subunit 5